MADNVSRFSPDKELDPNKVERNWCTHQQEYVAFIDFPRRFIFIWRYVMPVKAKPFAG
jgi:hypothetical protein